MQQPQNKYYMAVDRGNTAAKACLYRDGELLETRVASEPREAADAIVKLSPEPISALIYSTVGQGGEEAMQFLRSYAPVALSLADDIKFPITIPEEYRSTLGVDRIAAAAGARLLYPDQQLLVVDAGTAVTYDLVSAGGRFIGGNIAPGMRISLDALNHFTALLPKLPVPLAPVTTGAIPSIIGSDTDSAIYLGVIYSIVGAIESLHRRLPDTRVILTGGNSSVLTDHLAIPHRCIPHLLTDGLIGILRMNIPLKCS